MLYHLKAPGLGPRPLAHKRLRTGGLSSLGFKVWDKAPSLCASRDSWPQTSWGTVTSPHKVLPKERLDPAYGGRGAE